MRYYWGLAVGHAYAHNQPVAASSLQCSDEEDDNHLSHIMDSLQIPHLSTGDEPEFTLENLEDDVVPEDGADEESTLIRYHGDIDPDEYYDMYG